VFILLSVAVVCCQGQGQGPGLRTTAATTAAEAATTAAATAAAGAAAAAEAAGGGDTARTVARLTTITTSPDIRRRRRRQGVKWLFCASSGAGLTQNNLATNQFMWTLHCDLLVRWH
jgi:hypothetical protein